MSTFQSGANIDIRPQEEKLKDYMHKEIVASSSMVNWVEKSKEQWRTFPDQNQDGSYSCVEQTTKKIGGVLFSLEEGSYIPFSAAFYQMRSNKPNGGMIGIEAFDIWKENGLPLEQLVPSDMMNDIQLDSIVIKQYEKDIAKIFAISNHVGIANGDFETVASTIQVTKKAIMAWFYFTEEEWDPLIPTIKNPNLSLVEALRHSVAIVDYFLFNGKKYLLIEDSAHFGGITRRLISEEFFKARNWFTRYPMKFKFQDQGDPVLEEKKPHYTFTNVLFFGAKNDDIKALQGILKYEGFFPVNTDSTGLYGAITAKALLKWQKKYAVASDEELDSLAGRKVGPKTIDKLNEIFG